MEQNILLINEENVPLLTEYEGEQLKLLQKSFIESYIKNKDSMTILEWLKLEFKNHLPDKSDKEIEEMSSEIISTLELTTEKQNSLSKAIANGRSKESWFASEVKKAISFLSTKQTVEYLKELDLAVASANNSLYSTILTQSGAVNQNPNLDGFIAEQYHAQTFNLNAQAKGSTYRAKVLQPEGAYNKNSVDIVVVDNNQKVVSRYQSKYCKDVNSTLESFEKGDYRGQQKLAPAEQVENGVLKDTNVKATDVIKAPDGTTSNPLTKADAIELQKEAQSGKWNELNWNEYKTKDLAIGVGKQACYSALQGVAIGVGFNIAQKVWNGEKIEGEEIIETAITTGADFGIKAAAAGALKVGVEKGVISAIPKGTPAGVIANIAYVGIETVKVAGKIVSGELTLKEGLDKIEQTGVSTVAGLVGGAKGMTIGASIGAIFGPVGATVGGFIGGTLGYMASSKVGETVVKGVQKIREKTVEVIKSVGSAIKSGVENFCSGVKNVFSSIFCW